MLLFAQIQLLVHWTWNHGWLVKAPGCLDLLPVALELVPWLSGEGSWLHVFTFLFPGEGSWLSGFTSCLPGLCSVAWWRFLDVWIHFLDTLLIPRLPGKCYCLLRFSSWCTGLDSMVAWWRLPVAWIWFLVQWNWFHYCLVKVPGCLDSLSGCLDLVPGVLNLVLHGVLPGCLDFLPGSLDLVPWFPGLSFMIAWWRFLLASIWFLVTGSCFYDVLVKVCGCLGPLPGSLKLVFLMLGCLLVGWSIPLHQNKTTKEKNTSIH